MHFWVPSGPAEIDTGARGQLKAALARNGSKGDPKIWDPGPAKIDAPVAEIRDRCLTLARSEEDPQNHLRHTAAHAGAFSPPRPRFARSRVPPAFRPMFEADSRDFRLRIVEHEAHLNEGRD
jgi:hypothetical protein